MQLSDKHLAAILQGTRDFAKEMLEELGAFTPFGAGCMPHGTLGFISFPPKHENIAMEELYREVEAELGRSAAEGDILAGVIVADLIVPESIQTPFRKAIGMHVEASGFCRFFYATYELSPAASGGKSEVTLGEMIPLETPPSIFATVQ